MNHSNKRKEMGTKERFNLSWHYNKAYCHVVGTIFLFSLLPVITSLLDPQQQQWRNQAPTMKSFGELARPRSKEPSNRSLCRYVSPRVAVFGASLENWVDKWLNPEFSLFPVIEPYLLLLLSFDSSDLIAFLNSFHLQLLLLRVF